MDHDLTEFKLLMFLVLSANALGDHGNSIALAHHATSAVKSVAIIILSIESTDTRSFADTSVSLTASLVMLPAKVEGASRKAESEPGQLQ